MFQILEVFRDSFHFLVLASIIIKIHFSSSSLVLFCPQVRVIRFTPMKPFRDGEGPSIERISWDQPMQPLQGPPGNALNHLVVRTAHTHSRELVLALANLKALSLELPNLPHYDGGNIGSSDIVERMSLCPNKGWLDFDRRPIHYPHLRILDVIFPWRFLMNQSNFSQGK